MTLSAEQVLALHGPIWHDLRVRIHPKRCRASSRTALLSTLNCKFIRQLERDFRRRRRADDVAQCSERLEIASWVIDVGGRYLDGAVEEPVARTPSLAQATVPWRAPLTAYAKIQAEPAASVPSMTQIPKRSIMCDSRVTAEYQSCI